MIDSYEKKVARAIRLLQSIPKDGPVEVSYSGGKDSDVILELARMAGIKYRAIYKNTTIDPPGTIAHAKENGAEILQPTHRFFELVAMNGAPNRFSRHCCRYLKEYKVLDRLDSCFGENFCANALEQALNTYARQGWKVLSCVLPGSNAQAEHAARDFLIVMERKVGLAQH